MKLVGFELIKGLGITMRHFIQTYTSKRTRPKDGQTANLKEKETGLFTVSYPEETMPVHDRFRVLPMLIYDGKEEDERTQEQERCTACGICAKVCPPQCIWITQASNDDGKAIPKAEQFKIDVDVCMNCGLCAEFCPFDAIKMDHSFELSDYDRVEDHIFDTDRLHVSTERYAETHPVAWAEELARKKAEAERKAEAAKKAAAAKAAKAAKEAEEAKKAAEAAPTEAAPEKPEGESA